MRHKCHALWVSIWVTCASIIFAVLFQFVHIPNHMYELQNFAIVVLAGMVSGSIVALVIFIDAYRTEKRETLEQYLFAADNLVANFLKLKCFVVKEPVELLKRYYDEEEKNAMTEVLGHRSKDGYNKLIYDDDHTLTHDVRDEWCKLVEPAYYDKRGTVTPEEYQKLLVDEVVRRANDYRTLMDRAIDSYIDLWDGISYTLMDRIYAQIAFFTGVAPQNRIMKDIHYPMHAKLKAMQDTVDGRFGKYKGGKDNHRAHVLTALTEVQNQIFTTEIREDKDGKATVVYNDFYTDMEKKLEDLRARATGTDPEYRERFCVCIVKNL